MADFYDNGFATGIQESSSEEARKLGHINYTLGPGEKLFICAYDKVHKVRSDVYAKHVFNCRAMYLKNMRRQGKEPEIKICRFNSLHHLYQDLMTTHEQHCPDAASVVNYLQSFSQATSFVDELKRRSRKDGEKRGESDGARGKERKASKATDVKVKNTHQQNEEEDWDEEVAQNLKRGRTTYDPKIKLANNQGRIIQNLPGITTRSERNAFRKTQSKAFYARQRVAEDKVLRSPKRTYKLENALKEEEDDFGPREVKWSRR